MQFTLEETNGNGRTPLPDERQWLAQIRSEIGEYASDMERFANTDVADILKSISSIHARLSHIRIECMRSGSRTANALRTQQIDPLIEALEFQFKVHSRSISIMELEWNMARGQG